MKREYRRKVKQLNRDGSLVRVHNSVAEAAEEVIITKEAIYNVLCGTRKTAANYKWEWN